MNAFTLVLKSLAFYRRTNLSVLLGAVVSSAVLVGALAVGDSVRFTLGRLREARLGRTELALVAPERFFTEELASRMVEALSTDVAAVMALPGAARSATGEKRANNVQVLGVDGRFWAMGTAQEGREIPESHAGVSEKLAARLGVGVGDDVLLRIGKQDRMPGEAPFASSDDGSLGLRLRVGEVVSDENLGRFSLRANHTAPYNVFVPLAQLGERMGLGGRANVMLVAGRAGKTVTAAEAGAALRDVWRLEDAGLRLRALGTGGVIELVSERVFLDAAVAEAALDAGHDARGILSYFVNGIISGERSTPYSVVSAPGEPVVPRGMSDGEIIINEWLAEDLGAGRGDTVRLVYFVLGASGGLEEATSSFVVKSVVPIEGAAADAELMPIFPGLSEAESCSEWEPGIPIDLDRVREKDEEYWERRRGTPKAFVTLGAAERMWGNRFGSLTAVRYRAAAGDAEEIAAGIMGGVDPASIGLVFSDVRGEGERAAAEAVDFGQLFMGLSFFLVGAALILTALLFVFAAEERAAERGTLLALGFTHRKARGMLLGEGAILAILGAGIGLPVGIAYNWGVLYGLNTIWGGAVASSRVHLYIEPATLLVAGAAGAVMSLASMWVAMRRHRARPVSQLQQSGALEGDVCGGKSPRVSLAVAGACAVGVAMILMLVEPRRGGAAVGAFFASGSLVLVGAVALCSAFLAKTGGSARQAALGTRALVFRNLSRRRGRSLATVAVLASGVFLVLAVGANRRSTAAAQERSSGTGGFALYGEAAIPILHDLNSQESRRLYDLEGTRFDDVRFVGMRLREGDDASCLNLNRTSRPRILGVRAEEFAERGAFTFVKTAFDSGGASPWLLLNEDLGAGTIPAIADDTVITWGLGKSVGETLSYVDEMGRELKLQLVGGIANSCLQGSVLISSDAFVEHFPSVAGRRVFLVDAPGDGAEGIGEIVAAVFQDYGLELSHAAERLREFNAVENTYLAIFMALGTLGLVLGSVGMGVVVLRNVLERRGELALMRAVGFSRGRIFRLVLLEHWFLLGAGVAAGAVSAIVAVLPAITSPGAPAPYGSTAVVLVAVAASGLVWTYVAAWLAMRGDLVGALRNE